MHLPKTPSALSRLTLRRSLYIVSALGSSPDHACWPLPDSHTKRYERIGWGWHVGWGWGRGAAHTEQPSGKGNQRTDITGGSPCLNANAQLAFLHPEGIELPRPLKPCRFSSAAAILSFPPHRQSINEERLKQRLLLGQDTVIPAKLACHSQNAPGIGNRRV